MKLGLVTSLPPSKVTLNEYGYHLTRHFSALEGVQELVVFSDVTQQQASISLALDASKVKIEKSWSFNNGWSVVTMLKSIRKNRPDVVLFNLQFMKFGDKKIQAALGLLLPFLVRLLGISVVVLMHNIVETTNFEKAGFTGSNFKIRIFKWIGNFLTRILLRSHLVVVTMDDYREVLSNKHNASNVIHIPHGTFDLEDQTELPKKDDTFRILTFGKFGTYKKVEHLIEATQKFVERSELPVELVIAGTNNPNSPNYLEEIEQQYKELDYLRFTGYVEENDVPELFNKSDVVVFPYVATTGSSGVLHQAGSYKKAAIMPKIGDLQRLVVEEGYSGAFFETGDAESLANAISELAENTALREQIGQTNYKAATAFPMSKVVKMYEEEFVKLTGLRRAA